MTEQAQNNKLQVTSCKLGVRSKEEIPSPISFSKLCFSSLWPPSLWWTLFLWQIRLKLRFPIYPNPSCLNSSRLQQVLIYHQFATAAAKTSANVITLPACTTGGQQGVIAQDRRPRRAWAKEGTPSSKSSSFLFINNCLITGYPFYFIRL